MSRDAPSPTELEVSVFGRGFGESILVHLGDAKWILIDSLADRDGAPSPLRYLTEIGVDPKSSLRLIVATHWHDDHIEGLSELYQEASNASLAMPQAMDRDETSAFISRVVSRGSPRISSGVRELEKIAEIRENENRPPFRLAKENTILLREYSMSHGHSVCVEALSPNDHDVQAFIAELANSPPVEPGQRAMPFERNDVSVALWISIGPHRLLFGADLENSTNSQRGWDAVINTPAPLYGQASFFKVAHHGSANGHHQSVWNNLLCSEPFVALTTYNRGYKLPTIPDVHRILQLTPHAYVTSKFERASAHPIAAVRKTLREAGITIKAKQPNAGHIRFRLNLGDPNANWDVQLFNDATPLVDILQILT